MKSKKLLLLLLVLAWNWSSQILTAQIVVYDDSDGPFTILAQMVTVLTPNGGENWNGSEAHDITWSLAASITNVNIDYSIDSGNNWTPVAANIANSGTYAWTLPATPSLNCLVRVSATGDAGNNDVSDGEFFISASALESVTTPSSPFGPDTGSMNVVYSFSSNGATSSLGHAVQYKFDWGDGTDSGWLATGITSNEHAWTAGGTFLVRAMARCATHTSVESSWSETHGIVISSVNAQTMLWNTFMGGSSGSAIADLEQVVATDASGNIYIMGSSNAAWGSPLNPYNSYTDVFVVKLNSSGVLQWLTFLGGTGNDYGNDIAVDSNGNVYITGQTSASWGSPIAPFKGSNDAFIAKLNTNGILQWHTFMGSLSADTGRGITVSENGNIYITGSSNSTWGYPYNPFTSNPDSFIAKLNASGVFQWHTFFDGSSTIYGRYEIVVDSSENLYVVGESYDSWGVPLNPHSGSGNDIFIAKFSKSSNRIWNTFLGANGFSERSGYIALDGSGNIYIAGTGNATWGTPVNPHSGGDDAIVAKLDANGACLWHTFMGGSSEDVSKGISVTLNGEVYVAGRSVATWGDPLNPYSGGSRDGFLAKLNTDGARRYNTFIGGSSSDEVKGITLDAFDNIFVTGKSSATWGDPVNPHSGNINGDAFAAKFGFDMDAIVVTSPNGGENWISGESRSITWCTNGTIANVNIDYSLTGGGSWTSVAGNIANGGAFDWTVPDTSSTNCLVRVSDAANASIRDQSNSVFTISPYVAPSISVLSPNGGENFPVWEEYTISWTSAGAVGNVNIDYSIDNGENWLFVASNCLNSGFYSWFVPDTPSTSCLVRVSDASNASVFDISNAVFTISPFKTITVTSPNGWENWAAGSSRNITWSSTGSIANVNIDYSIDLGNNWNPVAANTANSGTYAWTVPATPSTNCLVRVSDAANSAIDDISDGSFSITIAPTITVISPNGGEQWQRGTTQIITWASSGVTNVKIELMKGTAVNRTITSSTPAANGSYNWAILATQTSGTDYKIRITSTVASTVTDSSDANFTIFAPTITVTAPAAGASWQRGVLHTITWTLGGTMNASVKILLYKGTKLNSTLATTTPNDGSFDWTIPAGQALATNYSIRIITVDNLVTGNSGTFSITATAGLSVISPNDGERLSASEIFPVRWTVDPAISEVKLEYSRDSGGTFFTIADNIPNSGQYDWPVPINFTSNGLIRVSDSHGKNWSDEDSVLECLLKFNSSSQQEARLPDVAVWFGSAKIKSPGYGFARLAIGRDMVRMAEISQDIVPLSGGWHEAKIRLDLKRDLGTLFMDGKPIMENVALNTSKNHHFEPFISIRAGGSAEVDLLLGELKLQVVLVGSAGEVQESFTVWNEDFSGYDAKHNMIGNCWQLNGLKADGSSLILKELPGMGRALRLHIADGMPVTICKPLAIPEKIPFDISDRTFSIEMLQRDN